MIALALTVACASGRLIKLVNTDMSRYNPGEPVTIYVDLSNDTGAPFTGNVTLSFYRLGDRAAADQEQSVNGLAPGGKATLVYSWTPPANDFTGYFLMVSANGLHWAIGDSAGCAVDVSSDWKRFPRYGYLSHYGTGFDPYHTVWQLKNLHINGLQFYDWQWKHHWPYSPDSHWPDIANRPTVRRTLASLITAAHDYRLMAMNYNLANGAYDDYGTDGSAVSRDWGLFNGALQDSVVLPPSWATPALVLFNPADPRWQSYICGREKEVFASFGFDGWHIDQLGPRANTTASGDPIDLPAAYAQFVHNMKTGLGRRVVFNAVGGFGQDSIAAAGDVEFVYAELWEDMGQKTYADLQTLAERAQAMTSSAIVLAAYMNKESPVSFNEPSVRLVNSAIAAVGAAHIELGDGDAMLSNEYFPHHPPLSISDSLWRAVMDEYHFLTAYENLLRDGVRRGDAEVTIRGVVTGTDGAAGKVWVLPRSKTGVDVVHLINLRNNFSSDWRDAAGTYPAPMPIGPAAIKIYYRGVLPSSARLGFASPDYDHGAPSFLAYTTGSDAHGQFVSAELPHLLYWDMLWLEKAEKPSGILLAEFGWNALMGGVPADWAELSGSWDASHDYWHHEMSVAQGGGILAYRTGFDTGDYMVEGDVHVTSTVGNGALLGRVQFDGGFYQVEIKAGTTWAIYKYDGTWRELASGPYPYSAGTTHHLKLWMSSNLLYANVDGKWVGWSRDVERPYYAGSVGLRSESQAVDFMNIVVTAL